MTARPTSSDSTRRLRQRSTDAERKFWLLLHDRRLEGWKFRRQVAIGPYVADFCCAAAKLIVELDGGQHVAQAAGDQTRTDWLMSQGYAVIRFWNNDVLANTEGVLTELLRHLQAKNPLTLPLSHKGRGNAVASNPFPDVSVGQNPEDQSASNSTANPDRSSKSARERGGSVPSPLVGEGQGEGVFNAAKNINRTQKP